MRETDFVPPPPAVYGMPFGFVSRAGECIHATLCDDVFSEHEVTSGRFEPADRLLLCWPDAFVLMRVSAHHSLADGLRGAELNIHPANTLSITLSLTGVVNFFP